MQHAAGTSLHLPVQDLSGSGCTVVRETEVVLAPGSHCLPGREIDISCIFFKTFHGLYFMAGFLICLQSLWNIVGSEVLNPTCPQLFKH
jgi:hypothetical protein